MIIKELKLKNFRCFEELTINFSIPYTVLIGINGSGKSSILDALRIIIDGFVSLSQRDARKGFAYINNIKLQESDAKIKTVIAGSTINKESCYPLAVSVTAEFSTGQSLSWTHELFSHASFKYNGVDKVGMYVRELQNRISNGKSVVCPIIVYYGMRRQWDKSGDPKPNEISFLSQMNGYVNCLSAKPFKIANTVGRYGFGSRRSTGHSRFGKNLRSAMIHIQKSNSPKKFQEFKLQNPQAHFDDMPTEVKDTLRQSLLEEQGYLCAYCMNRIRDKIKIEHYENGEYRPYCGILIDYLVKCLKRWSQ